MKNLLRIFVVLLIFCSCRIQAQGAKKYYLSGENTVERLNTILIPRSDFHPYPTIKERDEWNKIPAEILIRMVHDGEKYLGFEWKTIPATTTLDFVRNGNRTRYEEISFGKRTALTNLLFAELAENKGRFIDDIINGVWAICEESFWGTSAHHIDSFDFDGLPNVEAPIVDLFAAETSALLSLTYYLLEDKLDVDSKLIRPRIKYEIDRRIFKPFMTINSWWTGFDEAPNNWNPWISSNVILSTLLMKEDKGDRAELIHRVLTILDNFINIYPEDGGCNEGPSYWTVAGGRLYMCLEYLYNATEGKISIYDEPLIKNIGAYIYKMHINKKYYFNTGDCPAAAECNPMLLYSFGKKVNDETLMSFGGYIKSLNSPGQYYFDSRASLRMTALFSNKEFEKFTGKAPMLKEFWLPQSQYMGARSFGGSAEGLYFAIQGGHNDESHNHNDVGNFIIYADGEPVIIDVGVETYTAKTFSPRRYEIWTMQSGYHNLPTINGVMQKDGAEFKASDLNFQPGDEVSGMSMDISKAYPSDAKVNKWVRSLSLNRTREIIELNDDYELKEIVEPVKLNFITCLDPEIKEDGEIILKPNSKFPMNTLKMRFDKNKYSVELEKINITDKKLFGVWGDSITRIIFSSLERKIRDEIKITFEKK